MQAVRYCGSDSSVSVIIPCFKATRYIAEALDSLRAQTFRNFEAIVINDCCPDTDNFEKALQPYMGEIVYLKLEKSLGPSGARNLGIRSSKAKYVALLDSDDAWASGYLEVLVSRLESDPKLDLIYPDAEYFGDTPWRGKTFMGMNPTISNPTLEDLILRKCNVFVGVTMRRETVLRAGLFDPDLRGVEDLDMWIRIRRCGGHVDSDRTVLGRYRLRNDSLSDDRVGLLKSCLQLCDKHLATNIDADERGWWQTSRSKYQAQMDIIRGKQALYAGRATDALRHFSSANRVFNNRHLEVEVWLLRVAPWLLSSYVRMRYRDEYTYLH